jgi:hypothetical protein
VREKSSYWSVIYFTTLTVLGPFSAEWWSDKNLEASITGLEVVTGEGENTTTLADKRGSLSPVNRRMQI